LLRRLSKQKNHRKGGFSAKLLLMLLQATASAN